MTVDLTAVPPEALTVAAGQAACVARDVPANAATAAALVRAAAERGAHVVVLPELFLTGYELDAIAGDPRLVPEADDARLDALRAACSETGTVVVVGAPARDATTGLLHISALVVGRDGRLVTRYDKQHVDAVERGAGFSPGAGGCTVTVAGWRLGLAVCWDSSYPEHARAAGLDGCHAYLVGAMFNHARGDHKRATVCPARALDNAFYVAAANHCGPSGPYVGCGHSAVWNPDGTVLADAGLDDPGLAVGRLEPDALARARAEDFVLVDPSLKTPAQPRLHAVA